MNAARPSGGHAAVGLAAALLLLGAGCHHHAGLRHGTAPVIPLPPPGAVPTELNKVTLPPYVVEPPDILLIEVLLPPLKPEGPPVAAAPQPISGQHLVRPDGTVGLGIYGSLPVAGMNLEQIQEAVRQFVAPKLDPPTQPEKLYVIVDVLAYNSKSYFVITDGGGFGEQVYEFPIQGSETVLSALANINGIPPVGSKRNIWVARRTPHGGDAEQILPVDWVGITQHGITATNYQVLPGDRIYVKSEKVQRFSNNLAKFLRPIEQVLGVTLLGSQTVNSIEGRGFFGNGR
ncbi:MAG TPA: polysaccharide biosynthesis/export family protein [Gemmataceae bacterium]